MANFFIWRSADENVDDIEFSQTSDYRLRDYTGALSNVAQAQTYKGLLQHGERFLDAEISGRLISIQAFLIDKDISVINRLKQDLAKACVAIPDREFNIPNLGTLFYFRQNKRTLQIDAMAINSPVFTNASTRGNVVNIDIEFFAPNPEWQVSPLFTNITIFENESLLDTNLMLRKKARGISFNTSNLNNSNLFILPASGRLFTDFSEYEVNETPFEWTPRLESIHNETEYASWLTVDEQEELGDNTLENTNPISSVLAMLSWNLINNINDIELVTRVKTSDRAGTQNRLLARMSGTQRSFNYAQRDVNGYFLDMYEANNVGYIRCGYYLAQEDIDYTLFTGGEIEYNWQVDTYYWLRLRLEGNEYKAKWWEDGEDEPINWLFEIETNHIASGYWNGVGGFWNQVDSVRNFDLFGAGLDGASAPRVDRLISAVNNESEFSAELTIVGTP